MTTPGVTPPAACEDIERVRRAAARIKDNWSLCDFLGKAEKEMLVATTIHACVRNFDEHGEVFSFRGNSLDQDSGAGLVENRSSYRALLDDGYLVETVREGRAVIKPTVKLLEKLERFFSLK